MVKGDTDWSQLGLGDESMYGTEVGDESMYGTVVGDESMYGTELGDESMYGTEVGDESMYGTEVGDESMYGTEIGDESVYGTDWGLIPEMGGTNLGQPDLAVLTGDMDWTQLELAAQTKLNSTSLLEMFLPVCPNKLNDCADVQERYEPSFSREECLTHPCYCNFSSCQEMLNCCPHDPRSYLQVTCQKTAFIIDGSIQIHAIFIVEKCLSETHHYAEKCLHTQTSDIVFSTASKLFYKNIYCAKCHVEKAVRSFEIKFACPFSNDTVHSKLSSGKCVALYVTNSTILTDIEYSLCNKHKRLPTFDLISTCNVSGQWQQSDPQIEWACKYLNQRFLQFKNPFCYICNPGQSRLIDLDFDVLLNLHCDAKSPYSSSCKGTANSVVTKPFDNMACRECNNQPKLFSFEILPPQTRFSESFTLKFDISSDDVTSLVQHIDTSIGDNSLYDMSSQNSDTVNVDSTLPGVQEALSGLCMDRKQCYADIYQSNTSMTSSLDTWCNECSCDDDCYKDSDYKCCIDKQLKDSIYACVKPSVVRIGSRNPEHEVYRVINEYHNNTHNESFGTRDQVPNIPIYKTISYRGNVVYRNVPAVSSNQVEGTVYIFLKVTCSRYAEVEHLNSLSLILTFIKRANCTAQFSGIKEDKCELSTMLEDFRHMCFVDGNWMDTNQTIDGCEVGRCFTPLLQYSHVSIRIEVCSYTTNLRSIHLASIQNSSRLSRNEPVLCALVSVIDRVTFIKDIQNTAFCQSADAATSNSTVIDYRSLISLSVPARTECLPLETTNLLQVR